MERDLKLVLMNTENEVDGFFDLDVASLPDWCRAEQQAIADGIHYLPTRAPTPAADGHYASAARAYELIGMVRQRAKELCGTWDAYGHHYFGALLYRTLDILRYNEVRRTKKLLALYSAAQILLQIKRWDFTVLGASAHQWVATVRTPSRRSGRPGCIPHASL